MKRIIAAFDGLDFSRGTLDYSIYAAKHTRSELVGVFLDDVRNHSYSVTEIVSEGGRLSDKALQTLDKKDEKKRNASVLLFENACKNAGIKYAVHRDKKTAIRELIQESLYCDLLIIDKKENFSSAEPGVPTDFFLDFLGSVHCPVLIVPAGFKKIEEIIFLYDGEPSSIKAIKMFSYTLMFNEVKRFEVLTVRGKNETLRIPGGHQIKEFIRARFPTAYFIIEKGSKKAEITEYVKPKENALVVLGGYGRGLVSRLLKPSLADLLIEKTSNPIFIAH